MKLEHGGKLNQFVEKYQIPLADWLDLSTGVSPFTYSIPSIPNAVYDRLLNRLPEEDDGLSEAASQYYFCHAKGCNSLLPIAGSQAAIMALPKLIAERVGENAKVALPEVGYKEHQKAWQSQFEINLYSGEPEAVLPAGIKVLVIINPNNPTGHQVNIEKLLNWQQQLNARGGYMLVDEAFIDCTPEKSLLSFFSGELPDNLVVLRSVGKFFGLAGARVGFVFANIKLLEQLDEMLGPWTIPGVSRLVVKTALLDNKWQKENRERIALQGNKLADLLAAFFPQNQLDTNPLFVRFRLGSKLGAQQLHHRLCQQGIFTRLCDEGNAIRFGLPKTQGDFHRLETVLTNINFNRIEENNE